MKFSEIVAQASALLQRKGRITYRALQREFTLDEAALADLKDELIEGEQVARDEQGKVLVWTGNAPVASSQLPVASSAQPAAPQPADSGLRTLDSKPPEAKRADGERRQLTVMFCDLVGSTALSEQLDPEEFREVMRAYQGVCAEVVSRYEGHIAQYLGDGLLVYFGYPIAHEDDAQRAVRAGLEIIAAIQKTVPSPRGALINQGPTEGQGKGAKVSTVTILTPHPNPFDEVYPEQSRRAQDRLPPQGGKEQSLQVRIGIHTGPVVVGEIGVGNKREQLALGETPNLAARLQGLAEPNTVSISATTQRLTAGLFDCQDLGLQTVKGISAALRVYRPLSESSAQSRLEAEVSTGKLTPLVGRANEVGLMLERWTAAQAGDGQVVLLSGEPGIGKSRLVQEVKEQVAQVGAVCLEFRCSPYYQNSAFYPVITHVQRVLHFERDDTPQVKLGKLQQTLAHYRFPQADTLPLLAALLSLPQPADAPLLNFSPQKQKQKTQDALVAWLVEEAERAPVYCIWEDLHWADPSTVELLGLLLDQIPTTRLLMLLTARPEFTPSWSSRTHLTSLTLARLPRTQAGEMIEKVTRGKSLPAEVHRQIVHKTDGVPLFVEELTKMVLESGLLRETNGHYELTGPLPPLAIPATLHDSLMARLDRLATVKEVAQLGATLGREFSYELIQAVSPVAERSLQQALTKLVEVEVLYQRGQPPQARYIFKHALIQDAAYQSLLKSTRQQYHQQIAQVLEERFPEAKETRPELLAHHYTEAGLKEQAIPYWQRAGQRATQHSANVEAIAYLTKGLELLKTLPDSLERAQQELDLQTTLGPTLMAAKGYAAPEVEQAYARARELCQQVGETPRLLQVLLGLEAFYFIRGKLQTARELGEQCLLLAQRMQDPARLLQAHYALGLTLVHLGELVFVREHIEQVIALYDSQKRRSRAVHDPGVGSLSYAALALWPLGYPDQALKRSHEAIALAQELSHPFSLAVALDFAAWLHQFCRERQAAQERAEAAIAVSTEHGFPFWLAMGAIVHGWALVEGGQGEKGVAQIHQGLADYQATGAELGRPYFLALLAEAYGKVGQVEEGLSVPAEALAQVDKTGERYYEAELYRLKGQLTLQKFQVSGSEFQVQNSPESEAEEYFLKAIEIARRQQAKSLELRAVVSLSQLWQQQGKQREAHSLLEEIYGWFTEGFDTKDLQEAKALLAELT
ncbi:MAG TPA: adenylate/guanylate cyclase domain-containing protein [Candidatus Binatia bacterium]|nr:adenylate/guanylate cyclase domain-containing protein [Candidatus Binatia bacterium]